MKPTWKETTVKLGDLQPWGHNPRTSTKKQAAKILASWEEFNQVHTFAIGPSLEVYDGHQRLSALLTLYGADYVVDARQASRALTEDERKRLVILLHAGAVGSWDWDLLSGWDADSLIEWGLDDSLLADWRRDVSALGALVGSEVDYEAEWQGMPEFEQEDKTSFQSIHVHFKDAGEVREFGELIGQSLTDKTRSVWFSEREQMDDGAERYAAS